jgi:Glucodextranase, domain B/PASTA domain
MFRLRIAAPAIALVALAAAPPAAQAVTMVTQTQITNWVSSDPGTPANNPYLISLDNPPTPTTLSVSGTASAVPGAQVDIVCFYGGNSQFAVLQSKLPVVNGKFATVQPAPALKGIAGHACRLRAVQASTEGPQVDTSSFAGPDVAVSEAALPAASISDGPVNQGKPYNSYLNDVTFTGFSAWTAAGTPGGSLGSFSFSPFACGGPDSAPIDPAFDLNSGNFAIDCAGSLLNDDLGAWGGRSEVQVDGRNAYDAAAAQALIPRTSGDNGSQDLAGFPTLTTTANWDPITGLMSSRTVEGIVECTGSNPYKPVIAQCPSFESAGVQLERDITTSDGGRVTTMTDTWSSTDGRVHTVDLLYDNFNGVGGQATGDRGYEFPRQTSFTQFGPGATLAGASSAPGSILVRANVAAPDGDPGQAAGAITFGTAPSGFRYVNNDEFEERQLLVIPAGAGASLSHIYSVGYSVADVNALALAAQDQFQGPSIVIGSPPSGTTVSTPMVTLTGLTSAGSGITSLVVGGQSVPVGPTGLWTQQVALSPGTNTITAVATDGAGATAQVQLAVTYNSPPAPPPMRCKVPKTKGMKLKVAEKAIRKARCKVGKVKWVKSHKVRHGRVMSTTPHAGDVLHAGSKIELFVSKGR